LKVSNFVVSLFQLFSDIFNCKQAHTQDRTCVCALRERERTRLRGNFERLHIRPREVACHDWTTPAPTAWHGAFDAILLDVPCSNTGVFRRRVDVRWRLQAPDIQALTRIQLALLENALPCLKPGGRLVYSTCSIDPEENQDLIATFLTAHPAWQLAAEHQSLPQKDHQDGAYAALLTRTGE
jgi:16S rRNA (cytosine967-C5)-methyltransferase